MSSPRRPAALIAIAVLAVAAVVRLGFLTTDSFWLDEAFSVRLALDHSAGELWTGTLDPLHPPLFYLVLQASLRHLGASEWAARLPSVLGSLLNVACVFLLARNLGLSRRAAVTAAILLAVAPLDVWYAREARMYALVASAALLFAIGLTMTSWLGPPIAAAALTTGVYLDYTMVPLACALIALWIVWWLRSGRRSGDLARLAIGVLPALWLCRGLWPQLTAVADGLHTVTFFAQMARLTGLTSFEGRQIPGLLALTAGGLGVAAMAVVIGLENARFRRWWTWSVSVSFAAATAAFAIPRGYSAKQMLVTGWPFVVVLTAWAVTNHRDERHGDTVGTPARSRLAMVVAVSCAAAVVTLMTHRADWRGVAAYLDRRSPSVGRVVVEPPWNTIPYDYYRPAHPARTVAGAGEPLSLSTGEVWLVAQRFGGTPPTSAVEQWLDAHLRLIESRPFARLEVRHYIPAR